MMAVGRLRFAFIAGVLVGVATAAGVSRTSPSGPRRVTVTIARPCANPQPLILGSHSWVSSDGAPSEWGNGPERGTFVNRSAGTAVFTSDADHRQITFTENPSRLSKLECLVG